jgi:hypothetical protein
MHIIEMKITWDTVKAKQGQRYSDNFGAKSKQNKAKQKKYEKGIRF